MRRLGIENSLSNITNFPGTRKASKYPGSLFVVHLDL